MQSNNHYLMLKALHDRPLPKHEFVVQFFHGTACVFNVDKLCGTAV